MDTLENPGILHQYCADSPQSGDGSADPMNSLLCYNPVATNAYQESNIYPPDYQDVNIWEDLLSQILVDENRDNGFPKSDDEELKIIEATAPKCPASQVFPEHLSSYNKKSLEPGEIIVESESRKSRKVRKGTEKGPRKVFKIRSEIDVLEDGYKWRKNGRKLLKSSPHLRSYYRCAGRNCSVKKRVEREATDPGLLITTYEGTHNHESHSRVGGMINLAQPTIVIVNGGEYSEALVKFASQYALMDSHQPFHCSVGSQQSIQPRDC